LSYKDTIAFVEALTINGKESRPMGTVLSKILKQTTHLSEDHEVSLFTLAYLADFDLKLSNKRTAALKESIELYLQKDKYTTTDLGYLLLAMK